MIRYHYQILILLLLVASFIGCSRSYNPIISSETAIISSVNYNSLPVLITDVGSDGSILGGMGSLGLFELHMNPQAMEAELTSLRGNLLTDVLEVVDITNFLQLAPCTDCVKIRSLSRDADGNLILSIGIKHPFQPGDPLKPITGRNRADLHVFNVEGIVISDALGKIYHGIGATVSGLNLLNADGYTGYLDNSLDAIFPTSATIHPYILHFDDYSAGNFDAGNPMGFASVTDPPPFGNLVMAMGCDYDYKDYVFKLTEPVNVIFAVGCTYAVSAATKQQRFTPEYRIPQHNKKAASEVRVEIISNNLKSGQVTSSAQLAIKVVDINHGVEVGNALNQMKSDSSVNKIYVDIPDVSSSVVMIDGTNPVSGSGHSDADPLIYNVTVTNSAGAPEGHYVGLVKVLDSYAVGQNTSPLLGNRDGIKRVSPYDNPLTGLFEITEFATYQIFSIDVAVGTQLTLISPNGGEVWEGLTHENITWYGSNDIEFVDIYYSKDDFAADNNMIVLNYPNTGTFDWYIPDDPSNTVKVKIKKSGGGIEDISDNYFTIRESSCDFGTTNFTLAQSYTITGRWTYMGVMVTQQDPIQRLVLQGYPSNDTLYIHNASNPNEVVASYNTGDLIYCNNNKAFWIDAVSEPGIDRIIYNNFGGGSPTDGYQLKTIDWNGSAFVNPQTLPKHGSIWSLCVTPEGDLISHNANTYTPTFYLRDKQANYALTTLFTLQQSTCPFGTVSNIKDIAYDWMLDAIVLMCRNTNVSDGGQVFVLSMNGQLLFQDLNVFGGSLISYNASVDVDIKDPTCHIVVYAGNNTNGGPSWIARYSWDFDEKVVNEYTGLTYGPARGELSKDGTLWAGWANGNGVHRFNPPPDW